MIPKLVPLLLLILVFSSSFLLYLSSAAFLCNKKDAVTLLKIKKYFGDAEGMALWNQSTDCCNWPEVDCYSGRGGRVNSLIIYNSSVSGRIPEFITDLSALDLLVIQNHPNLSGPIPDIFAKFPSITSVQINYNANLSGPIPPSLCSMPSNSLVTLTRNRLTGSIPDCFGANFTFLEFSHNQLTGSIPASIMKGVSSPTQTPYLDLSDNKLSGSIPRSLGDRNPSTIKLARNRLTGDASFLFGKMKSAYEIDLSANKFEFDLSRVRFPNSLVRLDISHNRIWGRIPKQIEKIPKLLFLDVSYNKLCGPIPKGYAFQNILNQSNYAHNKCLCGAPLPPCRR